MSISFKWCKQFNVHVDFFVICDHNIVPFELDTNIIFYCKSIDSFHHIFWKLITCLWCEALLNFDGTCYVICDTIVTIVKQWKTFSTYICNINTSILSII
jgi:hypothetical protein